MAGICPKKKCSTLTCLFVCLPAVFVKAFNFRCLAQRFKEEKKRRRNEHLDIFWLALHNSFRVAEMRFLSHEPESPIVIGQHLKRAENMFPLIQHGMFCMLNDQSHICNIKQYTVSTESNSHKQLCPLGLITQESYFIYMQMPYAVIMCHTHVEVLNEILTIYLAPNLF